MNADQIKVEWANGQQQWCIVGGGLPAGTCWDAFDSRDAAIKLAQELAVEMCVEFVD